MSVVADGVSVDARKSKFRRNKKKIIQKDLRAVPVARGSCADKASALLDVPCRFLPRRPAGLGYFGLASSQSYKKVRPCRN
jgi:hypothetical protein